MGLESVALKLIEKGVDLSSVDRNHKSALMIAKEKGLDSVRLKNKKLSSETGNNQDDDVMNNRKTKKQKTNNNAIITV